MSGSDNSSGLMSSAGLVRYFDSSGSNAIKLNRKSVVAAAFFFGIIVMMAHTLV